MIKGVSKPALGIRAEHAGAVLAIAWIGSGCLQILGPNLTSDNPATTPLSSSPSRAVNPPNFTFTPTGAYIGASNVLTLTLNGGGGFAFSPQTQVRVGGAACTQVTPINPYKATCTLPTLAPGAVAVTIANPLETTYTASGSVTYMNFSQVDTLAGTSGTTGAAPTGNSVIGASSGLFNWIGDVLVSGNTAYLADSGNYVIKALDLTTSKISVLVGNGIGSVAVDGVGTAAAVDGITQMDQDGNSLYYTTCWYGTSLRMVDMTTLQVSNVAGNPNVWSFADGTGDAALTNCLGGVAHDANFIYVVDAGNYAIRKVTKSSPHVMTTIAGTPTVQGTADGPAASATFVWPWGLTIIGRQLYIGDGSAIRVLDLNSLVVSTLAGNVTQAGFVDGSGSSARLQGGELIHAMGSKILIADGANNAIRLMSQSGQVSTLFGTPANALDTDGALSGAATNYPISAFYAPGFGILFSNNTTLRYVH